MNTYEINNRNEVIPYTSGRKCTDTMAWREATELELQQQDQIKTLETELTAVTEQLTAAREELAELKEEYGTWWAQKRIAIDELKEVTEQRDKLAEALSQCREDSVQLLGDRDWWQYEIRLDYQKRYQETRDNVTRADEALQSLIKPTKL